MGRGFTPRQQEINPVRKTQGMNPCATGRWLVCSRQAQNDRSVCAGGFRWDLRRRGRFRSRSCWGELFAWRRVWGFSTWFFRRSSIITTRSRGRARDGRCPADSGGPAERGGCRRRLFAVWKFLGATVGLVPDCVHFFCHRSSGGLVFDCGPLCHAGLRAALDSPRAGALAEEGSDRARLRGRPHPLGSVGGTEDGEAVKGLNRKRIGAVCVTLTRVLREPMERRRAMMCSEMQGN